MHDFLTHEKIFHTKSHTQNDFYKEKGFQKNSETLVFTVVGHQGLEPGTY